MKKESTSSCGNEHWKEHKTEHNRLVKLLTSTGERKEEPTNQLKTVREQPNDRCDCGSKKYKVQNTKN